MRSQPTLTIRDSKNFIMHPNIIRMSSQLNNEDLGRLVRHFFLYAENGQTPDEEKDLTVTIIFNEWRIHFEYDKARYEAVSQIRREAGRKRWNKTHDTEHTVPVSPTSPTSPTPNDTTITTPMTNDGIATQGMEKMEEPETSAGTDSEEKEKDPSPTVEAKRKGKVPHTNNLETRKNDFYQSILPYADQSDREMLNDFFQYWTELDKQRQRMRFEMQKTWETGKRLSTWARRESRN